MTIPPSPVASAASRAPIPRLLPTPRLGASSMCRSPLIGLLAQSWPRRRRSYARGASVGPSICGADVPERVAVDGVTFELPTSWRIDHHEVQSNHGQVVLVFPLQVPNWNHRHVKEEPTFMGSVLIEFERHAAKVD